MNGAGARGFQLMRLFGAEVRLDWSLVIIFALITMNLGARLFPGWHPNWPVALCWSAAAIAAALFVASVLLHELAHALAARAVGVPIRGITLFLFGGV